MHLSVIGLRIDCRYIAVFFTGIYGFFTGLYGKGMKVLAVSFVVSFVVFTFLNVFENYFNFLIGKGATELQTPTKREAFRMAVVLVLFAALQCVLT